MGCNRPAEPNLGQRAPRTTTPTEGVRGTPSLQLGHQGGLAVCQRAPTERPRWTLATPPTPRWGEASAIPSARTARLVRRRWQYCSRPRRPPPELPLESARGRGPEPLETLSARGLAPTGLPPRRSAHTSAPAPPQAERGLVFFQSGRVTVIPTGYTDVSPTTEPTASPSRTASGGTRRPSSTGRSGGGRRAGAEPPQEGGCAATHARASPPTNAVWRRQCIQPDADRIHLPRAIPATSTSVRDGWGRRACLPHLAPRDGWSARPS